MTTLFAKLRELRAKATPAVEPAPTIEAAASQNGHGAETLPPTSLVEAVKVDDLPADAGTMLVLTLPAAEEVAVQNGNGHHAEWDDLLGADSSTGAEGDDMTPHLPGNWPTDQEVAEIGEMIRQRQLKRVPRKPRPKRPKGHLAKTAGSRRFALHAARLKAFAAQRKEQSARAELRKRLRPAQVLFTERQYERLANRQLFRAHTRQRLLGHISPSLPASRRVEQAAKAVAQSRELAHDLSIHARRLSPTAKTRWVQRAKVVRFLQQQAKGEQYYNVCRHEPQCEETRTAEGLGEVLFFEHNEQPVFRCAHCEFISFDGNNWVSPDPVVEVEDEDGRLTRTHTYVARGRVHSERAPKHLDLMFEEDIAALTNRPVGHCGQQTKCKNVTVDGHRWGSSLRKFELKRFGRPSLFRRNQQYGTLPRHRREPDCEKTRYMLEPRDAHIYTAFWFTQYDDETGEPLHDFDKMDFPRMTYHDEFGLIPEQLWDYLDMDLDDVTASDFDNIEDTCDFIMFVFKFIDHLHPAIADKARHLAVGLIDSGNLRLLMDINRNLVAAFIRGITALQVDEFNQPVRAKAVEFVRSVQPARQPARA